MIACATATATTDVERRPQLWHAERIALDAPSLRPRLRELTLEDGRLVDDLFADLMNHTGYITWSESSSMASKLRFALEVAFLAHHGQWRRSGEPFISHPVQVACILAQARMDLTSLAAGLLHDTVEDSPLTFEEVQACFGKEVRIIVEGETKVSKLPKVVRAQLGRGGGAHAASGGRAPSSSKRDEQAENLRSMFVAMADEWRIVVVKLADRLHNMRTLQYMPPHKRVAIARETLEIFTPLAHRLGMWSFKTELADLSFSYLFPEEHARLKAYIDGKAGAHLAALRAAEAEIKAITEGDGWLRGRVRRVSIEGRTKSVQSTWRKIQRRECRVEEVHDLLAMRIVLELPHDAAELDPHAMEAEESSVCYHVLGKVHHCWTPMPRTLKDYISAPKPNGYRSLHTTVLVGTQAGAQPLEVQIRTTSMHNIAEHGAAAHWNRPAEGASLPWRQAIQQWDENHQCAHEFMSNVRRELLSTRVFVFTEGGRILNLALGATLADAAETLRVPLHTGDTSPYICSHNMCEAATLDTELRNGDIVCFSPTEGHATREATSLTGTSFAGRDTEEAFSCTTASATISDAAAAAAIPGATKAHSDTPTTKQPPTRRTAASSADLVDGCWLADKAWHVCELCMPLPGDTLECTVRALRGGGNEGFLHRAASGAVGAPSARCKLLRRQLADGSQLVESGEDMCALAEGSFEESHAAAAAGGGGATATSATPLRTSLVIFLRDGAGGLLQLTQVITDHVVTITDVNSMVRPGDAHHAEAIGAFQFRVQIRSTAELEELTDALARLPSVIDVRRDALEMMLEGAPDKDRFWQEALDAASTSQSQHDVPVDRNT